MPAVVGQVLSLDGFGWLVLTMGVAGVVRGFTGFGSAMIIMPVASSILSPVGALIMLVMCDVVGPLPNLPGALRSAERGDVLRLGLGAALGLPFGVWLLSGMSPEVFSWMVSILVLVLLAALLAGWRYQGRLTPRQVVATGAAGGLLAGSSGLAGPPVIMLYMASTLPGATIRANLLLYLVLIDVLMIVVFAVSGLFSWVPAVAGLLMAVPYMAGNLAGGRLFARGRDRDFRMVAYAIIAASAILGLPIWS